MKKATFLISLILLTIVLASCNESEDLDKYANWRERNEFFIDSLKQVFELKTDPELKSILYSRDKKYSIYYKKRVEVLTGQPPYFTSTVRYSFREMLINEGVFGSSSNSRYYTRLYEHLDVVRTNMKRADPSAFDIPEKVTINRIQARSDLSNAYEEVFQYMKAGERWEVYIPWELAYGANGAGVTIGYSAIIADLVLIDVEYYE